MAAFAQTTTPFQILHVTGERDYPSVAERLTGPGANPSYRAFPFLADFPLALAVADAAVSRAGGSVAELLARGVPALLVPYPLAAGDHQTKNARSVVAAGAALMIPDGELTPARLADRVKTLLDPVQVFHEESSSRPGSTRRGYPHRRRRSRIGLRKDGRIDD